MSDIPLDPIVRSDDPQSAQGRPADLWATLISTCGVILSVAGAIWFFAGFAENDTRPEHLASAFILTFGLFILAIAPFAIIAEFARRAYRQGGKQAHYLWTLFLMLPWLVLGTLSISQTPLPRWAGYIAILLSTSLILWALISILLNRRANRPSLTQTLNKIEKTTDENLS